DFLYTTAGSVGVLGTGLLRQRAHARPITRKGDRNDQLHVAVIGVHGRGQDHIDGIARKNKCVIRTLFDFGEALIGPARKQCARLQGKSPRYEQDIRRLLDDKTIDIVTIATPNHWHTLAAIWAMQAGKDVYVEKPVSHNVREGRRLVETARKYKR